MSIMTFMSTTGGAARALFNRILAWCLAGEQATMMAVLVFN
jgi:hypothetical protein